MVNFYNGADAEWLKSGLGAVGLLESFQHSEKWRLSKISIELSMQSISLMLLKQIMASEMPLFVLTGNVKGHERVDDWL